MAASRPRCQSDSLSFFDLFPSLVGSGYASIHTYCAIVSKGQRIILDLVNYVYHECRSIVCVLFVDRSQFICRHHHCKIPRNISWLVGWLGFRTYKTWYCIAIFSHASLCHRLWTKKKNLTERKKSGKYCPDVFCDVCPCWSYNS